MNRNVAQPDGDLPWLRMKELHLKLAVKRRLGRGIPVRLADRPYSVIAVLGQSNAHGAGVGLDLAGLDAPHPDVHQWPSSGRSRGTVVLGVDPLFHYVPSAAVGFGCTFAREMAQATATPVLLVPAALGDTSFAPKNGFTWDPADRTTRTNLYRHALRSIDGALATQPGNRLAGVLWHQGESDAPLTPAADYADKLDCLIEGIRARYDTELPFVVGQMVPETIEQSRPEYREIDAVHRDAPNRLERVHFVAGPRDSYNSPDELVHYNAEGQRELGRRMWQAFHASNTGVRPN